MSKTHRVVFLCLILLVALIIQLVVAREVSQNRYEKIENTDLLASVIEEKKDTKETIIAKISLVASKYGVSSYQMKRTIECESSFRNIQSEIVNEKGEREDSWGICQINLPSHPEISREQALDTDFSLNFLASEISAGRDGQWYGYDKERDVCRAGYEPTQLGVYQGS